MSAKKRVDEFLEGLLSDAWSRRSRERDELQAAIIEAQQAIADGQVQISQREAALAEIEADIAEIDKRLKELRGKP